MFNMSIHRNNESVILNFPTEQAMKDVADLIQDCPGVEILTHIESDTLTEEERGE